VRRYPIHYTLNFTEAPSARREEVMAEEPTPSQRALASRLRELRQTLRPDRVVLQREVADALGVSVALVSSWESERNPVVPPEERLKGFAQFFATPRSVDDGGRLVEDLTGDEESRRRSLIDDLVRLREEALSDAVPGRRERGALGGRFWHFPDGQPIRIITSRLSRRALTSPGARANDGDGTEPVPYADGWHPNFIDTLWDGDAPSTLELFGHIRAENPSSEVRFYTADKVTQNALTGHVVVLGQGDEFRPKVAWDDRGAMQWLIRRHSLPWLARLPVGGDEEFDSEFVVTLDDEGEPTHFPLGNHSREEVHRPVFLRDVSGSSRSRLLVHGYPQLEYDVAVLARMPNQLNLSATVTVCSGIFSRGTYGAVRAFTDANLRTRNEEWLYAHVDPTDFWMFLQVPVFPGADGAETVTPDLERPFHRLRVSSRRVSATP
jgi:transcriptional regulator with XRE-family HTH domain